MNHESKHLKSFLPYLIICLVGLAMYFQTLFFGFTYFDDDLLILENAHWLSNIANFWQAFGHDVYRIVASTPATYFYYRPFEPISFMLDAQWGGLSAFSFHFTNIIIHLAAASLLFIFLLKLNYKRGLTFLGALIFTVHPAIASAVAWIPGRNDSLLAVFALSSFIFFIDYIEKEKLWDGILSVIFFFFALLTKEAALALVVFFWFYLRFMATRKLASNKTYFLTGGWILAVGGWYYLRQGVASRMLSPSLYLMLKALVANWPTFIQSLGKVFLPFNLAVAPSIRDTTMLYGYLALTALILLLIFTRVRRYNFILFGLLWFMLFLLPTQIVFYAFQLEHRLYLPMMGIIILLLETDPIKKLNFKGWRAVGIGLVLCLFFVINIIHSRDYRDRLTFWRGAARSSPHSAMARLNLGLAYYEQQMTGEAVSEYNQTLELNPTEPYLHNNLGLLYLSKKMWREAESEFNKELAVNPDNDMALYNLGILFANLGQLKRAEKYWKKTLEVNPERVKAYKNLAYYYYLTKDYKQADYYVAQLAIRGIQLDLKKSIEQAEKKLGRQQP